MSLHILFILFISIFKAYGFVENTVKGYPNCMACHISPAGGGILTDYGRSLSPELMSTWKFGNNFEHPFYGIGRNSENLKWGGQFRAVQVHTENDRAKVGKLFTMQNNLEFAVQYMNAFVVGTIGTQEGPENYPDKGKFLSERHYLIWEILNNLRVRFGKFRQHFGINSANHTRLVRRPFFNETYNLELSKHYEWGEINASIGLQEQKKDSLAINYTHYGQGNSRLGGSLFWGERKSYGLNAVFPIGKSGIGRSEIIYEKKQDLDTLYGDHNYGIRFFKGGLGYLILEHGQKNLHNSDTLVISPGIGFQFLPTSHVELQFEYLKKSYQNNSNYTEHFSFLTLHLYH